MRGWSAAESPALVACVVVIEELRLLSGKIASLLVFRRLVCGVGVIPLPMFSGGIHDLEVSEDREGFLQRVKLAVECRGPTYARRPEALPRDVAWKHFILGTGDMRGSDILVAKLNGMIFCGGWRRCSWRQLDKYWAQGGGCICIATSACIDLRRQQTL